jgi:replicative DNA helicase
LLSLAENILKHFRGRANYVAVGFIDAKGDPAFEPKELDSPLKPKWLESEHLDGKRCLGFYLMTEDSKVFCTCVDFDNKPDNPDPEWQIKAETVYFELAKWGFAPVVELSQSGTAAHVWLFFDEPVDAWLVRRFWAGIESKSAVRFVEVYPRQDDLAGKRLGNLIRYPLWKQSRFVDVENDWATLDPQETLESIQPADASLLRLVCFKIDGKAPSAPQDRLERSGLTPRVDRLVSRSHTLLGRRWAGDMEGLKDKSRSALALSIACELVRLYVPTLEIEQAIRVWCDTNSYDKGEREDWVETTVSKAYEFIGGRQSERLGTTSTMQDAALAYLEKLKSGVPACFGTGIYEVDRSIDGVAPGEVCVIAARPSHGKTAFGMQWVDRVAASGIPTLIISEEMSKAELGKRALLSISELCEEVWHDKVERLTAEVTSHYKDRATIHLVESCQTIAEVERQVDEHCELHDVKLVAVDYLQLLGSEHASRYDSVTEISRRLKQTATRNQVAMLVLCQLNREVEKRDGNDPKLSDLRESGQIEQDADLVLMLQWPVRHDHNLDPDTYKVFCSKRRNGPVRESVVFTKFNPEHQRFGHEISDFVVEGEDLPPNLYAGNGR